MAEKRHNRQELISRDRFIDMTLPEDPSPVIYAEDDSLLDKWWRQRKDIDQRLDELVSRIDASPLKAAFMDSQAACTIIDEGEEFVDSVIEDFFTFRFDAGDGLVLDFSLTLRSGRELPEDWPLIDSIGRILDAVRRIGPELGDGMRIYYDNVYRWRSFAVDLFQFPITTVYSLFDYFVWGPYTSETDEFYIRQRPTPYMKDMFMVSCRCEADNSDYPYDPVCTVFPHQPTPEDLALATRLEPDLYAIGKEVSRPGDSGEDRIWYVDYHIEVFRDGEDRS